MKLFKSLILCVNNFSYAKISDRIRSFCVKNAASARKDRRVEDRIKAVLLSDKGWSYRQIVKALLIDDQSSLEERKEDQKLMV
ncbi:hypothetical protein [Holospora undulata]|uniref:Uncharacterized protein n=1 Tax=Holospora undulata HU1 TaxID=1321371 RepID=A0A061JI59_9PROT|nr:hypothetical protein [Holospora undulata]ETZ05237.1 hypothetical protein K737_300328 [Holospora undulata HU1]